MTDLIERTRPTEEGLLDLWTPQALETTLEVVRAGAGTRRAPRRWTVAVAASIVAALTVAVPVAFPGWFASTAAAQELQQIAARASAQEAVQWGEGQYLRVRSIETHASSADGSTQAGETTYDDFVTADGWTWSDRIVDGESERYVLAPGWGWHRPDYIARMPTEAHLLDAFLRLRASGSTSPDEAVFVAIGDMLRQEAATPAVRAAALGVLALNPKVTLEEVDDPLGRPAVKVVFVDQAARPGVRQYLYLDAATGVLLASGRTWSDGSYQTVVSSREVVDALPAELVEVLGDERVAKEVVNGVTRVLDSDPGMDPVPVPEETWTPTPKR